MPHGGHGSRRRRAAAACGSSHRRESNSALSSIISPFAQSMIGKKRKQMRVFLGDLLEGGKVEGLYWTDKEKMIFRMPWKHAKKKDYDPNKDAELVKLWAINTRRYGQAGQDHDATSWKINFRCALNSLKESIVEVENNEEEDHRIYRFDDSKRGRLKSKLAATESSQAVEAAAAPASPAGSCTSSSSSSEHSSNCSESSMTDSPMSMDEMMEDAFTAGVASTVAHTTAINGYVSTFPTMATAQGGVDHWAPDNTQINDDSLQQIIANLSHLNSGNSDTSDAWMDSFLSPVNNSNDTSGENMANKGTKAGAAKHSQSSSKGKSLPSNAPVTVESENDSGVENDKESLPDCHEVYVKVCYRGSPMAGMKVDNRLGCRIFFGPCVASSGVSEEEHARLFGGRHLTQLSLPPPGQAQSILPSIWYLLDSLQRGIILEVISNDIYATRLCHANVYWGAPAHLGDTCALERGVRTRIFNYQLFLQIYKHFRDDPDRTALASQPPAPSVLLGVGQPWGPERQLDNNLVMISVTHCLAEHLMELLHRHRWETQRPFDTDYLMIDLMNDDDKLAMAKTRLTLDRLGLEKDEHRADAASTDAAGKLTPLNLSSLPVGM